MIAVRLRPLLFVALLPGCRARPETRPAVAGALPCGERAAVAVLRTPPTRQRVRGTAPGALVVRVAAADAGSSRPVGPVRVIAASATERPIELRVEESGVARSGALGPGRWIVEATGRGYETRRFTVAVRPGLTDTVRFRLARACRSPRA